MQKLEMTSINAVRKLLSFPLCRNTDSLHKQRTDISYAGYLHSSIADPGCLSRIPESNFSIPYPGFWIQGPKRFGIPDPDPHQRIEGFLALKTVSKL
jgi:hypothetical protein